MRACVSARARASERASERATASRCSTQTAPAKKRSRAAEQRVAIRAAERGQGRPPCVRGTKRGGRMGGGSNARLLYRRAHTPTRSRGVTPLAISHSHERGHGGSRRDHDGSQWGRNGAARRTLERQTALTINRPELLKTRNQLHATRDQNDNSVGWHLTTNSFHQHVRLLKKISPHTFF